MNGRADSSWLAVWLFVFQPFEKYVDFGGQVRFRYKKCDTCMID